MAAILLRRLAQAAPFQRGTHSSSQVVIPFEKSVSQKSLSPISDQLEIGLLVENMAASHLRALAYQEDVRLYHWRYKSNCEIDLVYDHPDDPIAFEVTASDSHSQRGVCAFHDKFWKFREACYVVSESQDLCAPTLTPQAKSRWTCFSCHLAGKSSTR